MRQHFVFVGGTFDLAGGRPSGYFGKLAAAVSAKLPGTQSTLLNGGSYDALAAAVKSLSGVTHLFWFADVPNDLPKLIPTILVNYPGLVLVGSKNNRKMLYDRAALYGRMRQSGSEFLVEFGDGADGRLVGSVLSASGTVVLESSPEIEVVASTLANEFRRLKSLLFPLKKVPVPTFDSNSFTTRDFEQETEIPLGAHVGAFGMKRRNHIHEGVDLYAHAGDEVFAMEDGIVRAVLPFTGKSVGSPWWNETSCVLVEGESGAINYGELCPDEGLVPGANVLAGQRLGQLVTVLTEDKGRPMTMLHLERYAAGTRAPISEWGLGQDQPDCLRNPTVLLMQASLGWKPDAEEIS